MSNEIPFSLFRNEECCWLLQQKTSNCLNLAFELVLMFELDNTSEQNYQSLRALFNLTKHFASILFSQLDYYFENKFLCREILMFKLYRYLNDFSRDIKNTIFKIV